eukprot:scaffold4120_cov400-Prasinococcus_capsulatus_cf.AAC.5
MHCTRPLHATPAIAAAPTDSPATAVGLSKTEAGLAAASEATSTEVVAEVVDALLVGCTATEKLSARDSLACQLPRSVRADTAQRAGPTRTLRAPGSLLCAPLMPSPLVVGVQARDSILGAWVGSFVRKGTAHQCRWN